MEKWQHFQLDESKCICQGEGWAMFEDSLEECPIHFDGQLHPDSKALLLDDIINLREEERKSKIIWKIKQNLKNISCLEKEITALKSENIKLYNDMLHKATTVKMKAIKIVDKLLVNK